MEVLLKGITCKLNSNKGIVITIKKEEFLASLSTAPELYNGTIVAVCPEHLLPKNGFSHGRPKVLAKEPA